MIMIVVIIMTILMQVFPVDDKVVQPHIDEMLSLQTLIGSTSDCVQLPLGIELHPRDVHVG